VKVKDFMSKDPVSIGPDAQVRTATEQMGEWGIRHLPVVDATGRLLGMLTDRDLAHAAFMPLLAEIMGGPTARFAAPRVRDVMTWSVITTHPEATLVQAALTMFQRRIGSLPVVEEGRLVGIVTEGDIMAMLTQHPQPAETLRSGDG
jgi:acetoin utilization protein AcuB